MSLFFTLSPAFSLFIFGDACSHFDFFGSSLFQVGNLNLSLPPIRKAEIIPVRIRVGEANTPDRH